MIVRPLSEAAMERRAEVARAYDFVADKYPSWYQSPRDRAEDAWVAGRVAPLIARGQVVDLGCGSVPLLDRVDVSGDRYLGVDISERMLKVAQMKYRHHKFLQASMEQVAFDSWDAVVSLFCAFCYVSEPEECLRVLFEALNPGGRLFLMVYGEATERANAYRIRDAQGKAVDRRCFGAVELRRMVRAAGFKDVRVCGLSSELVVGLVKEGASQRVADALVALDAATVGRLRPDACRFLVAEGRR